MSRAIQLAAEPIEERGLPLAGQIAAGVLHEAIEQNERVDFQEMFDPKSKNLFVLQVKGESMIEDQIADGDFVIVQKQKVARKGQIVVALTDEGEATLKRWFPEKNRIRLEPANATMKPIYVKDARVLGIVVGVVRRVG
jgi:repressor LexA